MSIGLIGVGLLGLAAAERLIQGKYPLLGYDLSPVAQSNLQVAGATVANSAQVVFASCQTIFLCLPNSSVVGEILSSSTIQPDQVLIDLTTGDPEDSEAFSRQVSSQGGTYLDANVSGSSHQLRLGEALLLVGATAVSFTSCHSLLTALTPRVIHVGPVGCGNRMKLVSNLILGLNRAALAEGLVFAESLGLDLRQTLAILRESIAYSKIMDTKGEKMIQGDFAPQAKLSQHLKDVHLMLHAALRHGSQLPFTNTHRQILDHAISLNLGDLDNSAIIQAISCLSSKDMAR